MSSSGLDRNKAVLDSQEDILYTDSEEESTGGSIEALEALINSRYDMLLGLTQITANRIEEMRISLQKIIESMDSNIYNVRRKEPSGNITSMQRASKYINKAEGIRRIQHGRR